MLAVQVRSGLVEAIYEGVFAAVDSDGELVAWSGDIDWPFYLRSAAKPFQALVAQELGADLTPLQLALACSSHDGLPVHVAIVEEMLAGAGLDEADLQCPSSWPISSMARDLLVAGGHRSPRAKYHNCSGKHAAWLRACVSSGLPTDTYLTPEHPVQVMVAELVAEVGGHDVQPVGVDGCGAPVLRTTVRAMARMFALLASEDRFAEVYTAMHRYPALVSGVANPDASIAVSLDAVAKRGASGCIGVGVRNQLGVAAKSFAGSDQVAGLAATTGLAATLPLSTPVSENLLAATEVKVMGGGVQVGSLESRLELSFP